MVSCSLAHVGQTWLIPPTKSKSQNATVHAIVLLIIFSTGLLSLVPTFAISPYFLGSPVCYSKLWQSLPCRRHQRQVLCCVFLVDSKQDWRLFIGCRFRSTRTDRFESSDYPMPRASQLKYLEKPIQFGCACRQYQVHTRTRSKSVPGLLRSPPAPPFIQYGEIYLNSTHRSALCFHKKASKEPRVSQ